LERLRAAGADEAWANRAKAVDADRLLRAAERAGLRFVIPGDPEWPPALADLAAPLVSGWGAVPLGLWAAGPGDLRDFAARSVAVVGSRAATAYGTRVATELAAELAAPDPTGLGWAVVSGGAFGIDAAAHRGAISGGGRTLGVYANGLDVAYPPGNSRLFEKMKSEHLVVSEVPPGLPPTRRGFLARNRLIAALSQGAVIVEAAARSGAKNTANWASALGRVVMAVPGPVFSAFSVTPHELIRAQEAVLVASPLDVRALLSPIGTVPEVPPRGPVRPTDSLTPVQERVHNALAWGNDRGVGELSLTSGVSVAECQAALATLAMLGMAKRSDTPGMWRLARAN
jgi:DNA processing protein